MSFIHNFGESPDLHSARTGDLMTLVVISRYTIFAYLWCTIWYVKCPHVAIAKQAQ